MTPTWFTRDIHPYDEGRDVLVTQRKVGAKQTGVHDRQSVRRVGGAQKKAGLSATGVVDEETAQVLGEDATHGFTPEWFTRELSLRDAEGEDVRGVRVLLGLGNADNRFDADLEAAVRRHQSGHKIAPTGRVDEATAKSLGDL